MHTVKIKLIQGKNSAKVIGYDQPEGEVSFLSSVLGYIVLKIKGHLSWSARSEQTYYPAKYQVFRIVEGDPGIDADYEVEHLFEFPTRKDTPYRVYREGKLIDSWYEKREY
jgi:hypothetical protein